MRKRIISLAVLVTLVLTLLALAVPALATDPVSFNITPDRTTAKPGDTINYTVTIGPIPESWGIQFKLAIPDGLTFKAGSSKVNETAIANKLMGGFAEKTLVFLATADPDAKGYFSFDETTTLLTFACTVNEDANGGDLSVTFVNSKSEIIAKDKTKLPIQDENPGSTVTVNVPVTGVTIDESMSMSIGEKKTPSYTVAPSNATDPEVSFSAEEGKENVATVDPKTGEVTGAGIGSMTVTVETKDGNFRAVCTVTVVCPGHTGGNSTCLEKAICSICHQPYGELGAHKLDSVPAVEETHTKDELKPAVAAHYKCSVCEKLFSDADGKNGTTLEALTGAAPEHVYDQKDNSALKTPANCGNDAVYYYTCTCGKAGTETYTAAGTATGQHQYTKQGKDDTQHWNYCEVCGAIQEPKTNHSDENGKWEYDKQNHYHTCGCGTIFDTTPHTFDQKVESEDALKSEATCNKDAEYYYSCVCGAISETETFTKAGSATGKHVDADGKWEYNDESHFHTCACETIFDQAEHTFTKKIESEATLKSAATCSKDAEYYYTCEICGAVSKTESYVLAGSATGEHVDADGKWESDEQNHYHTCGCGEKFDVEAHSYEELAVEDALKTPATCETDAEYYKSCKCGRLSAETFVAENSALGHKASEWQKVDEKTHQQICLNCQKVLATGEHELELVGQKEATEKEKGYTGDKTCKDCGYVAEQGKEIPVKERPADPKTGDESGIQSWLLVAAIAGLTLAGAGMTLGLKKKRKN